MDFLQNDQKSEYCTIFCHYITSNYGLQLYTMNYRKQGGFLVKPLKKEYIYYGGNESWQRAD